jgi:YD repeat-containing protein
MKKLIIYGVALAMCLAAGCKKDNKNTKAYLLKQQITDETDEGIPLDTANYDYDANNRVTTIIDGSGQNKITFAVTYDGQGRVNTAKKFNSVGTLIIEYDFFYRTDSAGYYLSGPAHAADTAYFLFNNKHQVSEIDTRNSGHTTFIYDSRGNVGMTQLYGSDGVNNLVNEDSYVYDSMKNPFSQMPPGNLFLEYIVMIDNPSTLINNVAGKDGDSFQYTYNADGFPESSLITLLDGDRVRVYYSYVIK